jgi:DNA repair photolyase
LATANPLYPDALRKQVGSMQMASAAYMSSFAEPFQILEGQYNVTQRLSQVFIDNNLPMFYLSRLIPPSWAIDALQQNPYSYMQWSVNTSNDAVYKKMSPGSYHIDDVLKSVNHLSSLGIYTSFQCNPILPGIVTLDELVTLVHLAAQAGLRHIIFKFVEQVFNNRKLLLDRLRANRLEGVDELDKVFTQTIGGVYTVDQDVRLEWLNVLLEETRKADITMSLCYEYYADGAAGANLAPYFTTSDQCHGRGVPVYYRPEPSKQFEPLPGCYRKGCLYCADYGTKACNNEILQEARALTYKDYRSIRLQGDDANWDMADSCARPELVGQSPARNPDLVTDAVMWGI